MLVKSKIISSFKAYVIRVNKQASDLETGSDQFGQYLETTIYTAITDADIVIPAGAIKVTGVNGISSNLTPIIIKKGLK